MWSENPVLKGLHVGKPHLVVLFIFLLHISAQQYVCGILHALYRSPGYPIAPIIQTRAVVLASPGHASPIEDPVRVCLWVACGV